MNEPHPAQPAPPALPPPAAPPAADEGTILAGFLLGWAAGIVGSVACAGAIGVLSLVASPEIVPLLVLAALLPIAAPCALLVWFVRQRKPRSVKGVWIALATQIGLALLLGGALILLLMNTDFR
jgi:hypothetical protein